MSSASEDLIVLLKGGPPWGIHLSEKLHTTHAGRLEVSEVDLRSSAFRMGVRVGDTLEVIDGKSAKQLGLLEVQRILNDTDCSRLTIKLSRLVYRSSYSDVESTSDIGTSYTSSAVAGEDTFEISRKPTLASSVSSVPLPARDISHHTRFENEDTDSENLDSHDGSIQHKIDERQSRLNYLLRQVSLNHNVNSHSRHPSERSSREVSFSAKPNDVCYNTRTGNAPLRISSSETSLNRRLVNGSSNPTSAVAQSNAVHNRRVALDSPRFPYKLYKPTGQIICAEDLGIPRVRVAKREPTPPPVLRMETKRSIESHIDWTPKKIEDYKPGKSSIIVKEYMRPPDDLELKLNNVPPENTPPVRSESKSSVKSSVECGPFVKAEPVLSRKEYAKVFHGGDIPQSGFCRTVHFEEPPKYRTKQTLLRAESPIEVEKRVILFTHALYDFQARVGSELSFRSGDALKVLNHLDDKWSYAELVRPSNQSTVLRGLVPRAYLKPTTKLPQVPAGDNANDGWPFESREDVCRALYQYLPRNADELELMVDDLLTILQRCGDGWFVGVSHRSGFCGVFPGNYVRDVL